MSRIDRGVCLAIDLCDANHVRGYPTLFMYEEGKMVEEYKGTRDLDDLKKFLKRWSEGSTIVEEPQPVVNTQGAVLPIHDSATLMATIQQSHAFIKFFAPWCGHCKKLAPTWVQLAAHLKNKVTVAEVDCEAHGSLCAQENIQGYPTLIYYNKGIRSEYNGGRRLDQLKSFAETAVEGRIHPLDNDSQLKTLVEEHNVLYLFLYSTSDADVKVCTLSLTSRIPPSPAHAEQRS